MLPPEQISSSPEFLSQKIARDVEYTIEQALEAYKNNAIAVFFSDLQDG